MAPQFAETIARLEPLVEPRRLERLRAVLATRSDHVTFVFERMVDLHNLSAALRSVDAFSFQDVHLVRPEAEAQVARLIARGAERWLSLHRHESMAGCVAALHAAGYRVYASRLAAGRAEAPAALEALDFGARTALLFGNEHDGVSDETLALSDGIFRIGTPGFAESLNLSVAAAICAYAARRAIDRLAAESADPGRFLLGAERREALYADWLRRSVRRSEDVLEHLGARTPA
ncbi:MAG: RNA methyltransferase [Candidatus Lambdaproteobacteria bacterium]|nr:RNA methyltransferase [Candidatus Lambdaproteobacteria bacterium]